MARRKIYEDDIDRLDNDDPELKPWHRRPNEPGKAYGMFKAYLKLGAGRSQGLLAARLSCSPRYIGNLSSRWDWVERSRRYDSRLADMELAAKEEVHAREAAKWAARRMEAADKNWDRAQKMAAKAEEMLEGKLYEDEVSEDGQTVVRKPIKWSMATAGALLKIAAELQAAALGEANGETDDGFDPAKATPEECRAYLAREGITLAGDREPAREPMKALPPPMREG